MLRKLTSAFAAIGILGTWGFMAYAGLPGPWVLKPVGVAWSAAPFFTINLLARKWTRLRARAAWCLCSAGSAGITVQGLYVMHIIDPRPEAPAMFYVLPFFTFVFIVPFLIAAFVFEHPSDDDD